MFDIVEPEGVRFIEPVGLFDFVKLEKSAKVIITDSGTVPEEATILRVPSVVIRQNIERPELIECGSTILCGIRSCDIVPAVNATLNTYHNWVIPEAYKIIDTSDRVVKLLLGRI